MANRSSDFNYKVALASGLKSLQGGRLRQAEEQFRYLMQHFPTAEGGYRGLAKVLVQHGDRAAALKVLLDGGAALAKAGQRDGAINVYKEAVQLDPRDRAAHRRLASSLALSGDTDAAAHEYVRYIREAGDAQAAQLEAAYALERMPHNAEIEEAARAVGAAPVAHEAAAHAEATQMSASDRDALMRSAFGTAAPAPEQTPPPANTWTPPSTPWTPPAPERAANDAWQPRADDAWQTTSTGADAWGAQPEAAPASENGEPMDAADDVAVEATAARYLAKGDPRGGTAALEAARRYIAAGRMDAASDLLLQLIAAGISDHDAQRLLVEVTKSLGKKDVAKAKVQLLVQALKLDGRNELAAEVEQLAQEA